MLEHLVQCAQLKGFQIKIESNKVLAESLDKIHSTDFKGLNSLVRMIATRCMSQAVYFSAGDEDPTEYAHYGLATPIYTHFTSPIRRYADIVVHRQLANSIGIAAIPESMQDRDKFGDICD